MTKSAGRLERPAALERLPITWTYVIGKAITQNNSA
jgi:hypothetical protein